MFFSVVHRALNKTAMVWHSIKTHCWHALFFQKIGRGTILRNPLFIVNPQRISIGKNVFIRDDARLEVVGSGSISIGDNSSFEQGLHVTSGGDLAIGSNVTFALGALVTNIDHGYQQIGVHIIGQPHMIRTTRIGDNCFLGARVVIQAGTVLGRQCVVGANAVVRGTFPDYCVLAGVPARVVKRYNQTSERWEKTHPDGSFQ